MKLFGVVPVEDYSVEILDEEKCEDAVIGNKVFNIENEESTSCDVDEH